MVIAQTEAEAGDELTVDIAAEYALLVLDGATVRVDHDGDQTAVDEPALVIVPPGASSVHIATSGRVIRVFAAATAPTPRRPLRQRRRLRGDRYQRRRVRRLARPDRRSQGPGLPAVGVSVRARPAGCDLPLLDGDGERAARGRPASRPDQAVAPPPRRLRAGVAAGRRRLRAPHAGAVDAGWVDVARRRSPPLHRPGGRRHPSPADPHQPVGRRHAALVDRRVRTATARLLAATGMGAQRR